MFRKIAAGTSAAVVAAGLAAAPAVAAGLPAPGDCVDVAPTETAGVDQPTSEGFVFGPLAEVPHFLTAERSCFVASAPAADPDLSAAHRRNSGPPPVKTPIPDVPTDVSPPADTSGPPPVDSGPPPAAPPAPPPVAPEAPPVETPAPAPPEAPPAPPAPRESGREANSVLPEAQPRLPQTAADTRPLTAAGGSSLIAAGLAWIGGARRRKKR
jgi:LPXTG-motif cell wall-anchored protein